MTTKVASMWPLLWGVWQRGARTREVLGCSRAGTPGFDERAHRGVEEPARFCMSPVDEAGDKGVALAGRHHRGVVQNDVRGGHRPATWSRRRSSSVSRSCCSAAVGAYPVHAFSRI